MTQVGTPTRRRPRLRRRRRRRRLDLRHRLHEGRARRPGTSATRTSSRSARAAGGAPIWIQQFGTAGEDKGMAVATGGGAVYVAGMVTAPLGTPLPGHDARRLDGFLAQFRRRGDRSWTRQIGTTGDEPGLGRRGRRVRQRDRGRLTRRRPLRAPRTATRTSSSPRFDPTGAVTLHDQLGTIGNDKGANVTLDGAGNTYVSRLQRRQPRDEHRRFDARAAQVRPGPDAPLDAPVRHRPRATAPTRSPRATSSSRRRARRLGVRASRYGSTLDPDAGRERRRSSRAP